MRHSGVRACGGAIVCLAVMLGGCQPGGPGGKAGQWPQAVQEAATTEAGGSFDAVGIERVGDREYYVAGYSKAGKRMESAFMPDGSVAWRQERVTLDDVPPAVRETIRQEVGPRGSLAQVSRTTFGPGAAPYRARIRLDNQTIDLQLSEGGGIQKRTVK